jgi:NADH:ubiquinone oxidoreductase subunit 5 (subunit L)/multisubunit Na+/H+ antiporter MnhA subunit
MMLALGMGQVALAIFHLIVHGFFKAALFLCAGNIGHAIHQPTANVDDVGGWRKALPWTYACFALAALALAGIWPFAGFYSKDAILDAAWQYGGPIKWAGLLISFGSAFYISRMLFLTFYGDRPEQKGLEAHPHEAGFLLVAPVFLLSLGALLGGVLGLGPAVERMVTLGWTGLPLGVLPPLSGSFNLPGSASVADLGFRDLFGRGCALAALGVLAAYFLTMADAGWDWRWRKSSPFLAAAFEADFGWKPLVGGLADGVGAFARFVGRVLDKKWWDGVIEGTAGAARGMGGFLGGAVSGRLNDYLWWMAAAAALLLGRALMLGAAR